MSYEPSVMYFNMNDPNVALQNVPQKQDSSMHVSIIVASLIFWRGLILGVLGTSQGFLTVGGTVGIIIATYFFYLICVCCCNDIKGYITNLQKFEDYTNIYDKMVKGKGYFHFFI